MVIDWILPALATGAAVLGALRLGIAAVDRAAARQRTTVISGCRVDFPLPPPAAIGETPRERAARRCC